MISSNNNTGVPVPTSGDAAVTLLTITSGYGLRVVIINEGSAPGYFSVDGGATWARLPAGPCSTPPIPNSSSSAGAVVQVKRVPGGADMTGLSAFAF